VDDPSNPAFTCVSIVRILFYEMTTVYKAYNVTIKAACSVLFLISWMWRNNLAEKKQQSYGKIEPGRRHVR